jgi:hypothetical protein
MVFADTRRIIAAVQGTVPFGEWPVDVLINKSVRINNSPAIVKLAITELAATYLASPNMTGAEFWPDRGAVAIYFLLEAVERIALGAARTTHFLERCFVVVGAFSHLFSFRTVYWGLLAVGLLRKHRFQPAIRLVPASFGFAQVQVLFLDEFLR